MFRKILIAVDEGGPARRAVEVGVELARTVGAAVAVLHVVDAAIAFRNDLCITDEEMLKDLWERGKQLVTTTVEKLAPTLKCEPMIVEGDPAETIMETASQWGADLIVLGSDGRGRLAHFLLGSTADAVIRRAPCPVLTARQVEAAAGLATTGRKTVAT